MTGYSEVLAFWFGDPGDEDFNEFRDAWFGKDEAFDSEVRSRFAGVVAKASAGDCDAWQETPDGALALTIVLDQFPRNIFRGLRDGRQGALRRAPGLGSRFRPAILDHAEAVSLSAVPAQRKPCRSASGSCAPDANSWGLRRRSLRTLPFRDSPPLRDHRAIRAISPPQRDVGAGDQRRGGGISRGTTIQFWLRL